MSAVIDPETGELATEWCPRRERDFFKPTRLPTTYCQLHQYHEPTIIADDGTVTGGRGDWLDQLGRRLKRILRF